MKNTIVIMSGSFNPPTIAMILGGVFYYSRLELEN